MINGIIFGLLFAVGFWLILLLLYPIRKKNITRQSQKEQHHEIK